MQEISSVLYQMKKADSESLQAENVQMTSCLSEIVSNFPREFTHPERNEMSVSQTYQICRRKLHFLTKIGILN